MLPWLTATIGLLVAGSILLLTRRDRLHARHALGWLLVAACFAVLGLFPGLLDAIASQLGVAYPPVLALTIAVAALVVKVLLMDIERARLEVRHQRLVQRLAMLESRLAQEAPPPVGEPR